MPQDIAREPAVVTGAAGFIGANLVRSLLSDGIPVHAFVRPGTDPWRIRGLGSGLTVHETELTDLSRLTKLVTAIRPAVIYHLAAHGAYHTQTDAGRMTEVNVLGTWNLLTATRDIPYRAFVTTGSSAEYGHVEGVMDERARIDPLTVYAATKAAATHLASVAALLWDKPVVCVRPFTVYGPWEEPSRFIPTVIARIAAGQPVDVTPGTLRHDYVYVGDAVACYRAVAASACRMAGGVYNIGSGRQYANGTVVRMIAGAMGMPVTVRRGTYPARSWDNTNWKSSPAAMARDAGWTATTPLSEGLAATVKWWQTHQHA